MDERRDPPPHAVNASMRDLLEFQLSEAVSPELKRAFAKMADHHNSLSSRTENLWGTVMTIRSELIDAINSKFDRLSAAMGVSEPNGHPQPMPHALTRRLESLDYEVEESPTGRHDIYRIRVRKEIKRWAFETVGDIARFAWRYVRKALGHLIGVLVAGALMYLFHRLGWLGH